MIWIEWFSMGFFFLAISITVLLAVDLSGVPDHLLLSHLCQSQLTQTLPSLLTSCGLFLLAAGCAPHLGHAKKCMPSKSFYLVLPRPNHTCLASCRRH